MLSKHIFILLALLCLLISGCNQGKAGGPGANDPQMKPPVFGQLSDTFNLGVPLLTTKFKQGEVKAASISITRGTNFDEEVKLSFTNLPKGVSVEPSLPVLKHGDTEAKISFHATETAALGDFTVKVIGHPTKGTDATVDFKITVDTK